MSARLDSFNGAEAKKPRKSYYMQSKRLHAQTLQWGRGKKASEIEFGSLYAIYTNYASMGPRQKSLGNKGMAMA